MDRSRKPAADLIFRHPCLCPAFCHFRRAV